MALEIPATIDEPTFRRLLLEGIGVDGTAIPPTLDTATFRRMAIAALNAQSGGGGGGTVPNASETVLGISRFATLTEVQTAAAVDAVVRSRYLPITFASGGGALSIGDLGGNARGARAINIQAGRASATQVAAGDDSIAIGTNSTCSGTQGVAIGYNSSASSGAVAIGTLSSATGNNFAIGTASSASARSSVAIGVNSSVSGSYSVCAGYKGSVSGMYSSAFGTYVSTNASYASCLGRGVATTVDRSMEIGLGDASGFATYNQRIVGIRMVGTQEVSWSIPTTNTAKIASASGPGNEVAGTLGDSMISWRVNNAGTSLIAEINFGGAIKTATLALA